MILSKEMSLEGKMAKKGEAAGAESYWRTIINTWSRVSLPDGCYISIPSVIG